MGFLIDCSHYQGNINWAQVKTDGCLGAYVKTTDGTSGVDAMWQTNHAGAHAVGLPVGPYHFAEGGNVSAEAAHFASVWSAGWELHPVLDYEIAGVNPGWLTAFRTYYRQDTGFQPFRVYASEGNLTGALNPAGWVDPDTTIWAARYAGSLGWSHPQLVLWQNTSSATVPGILGNVDEDQFQNGWTPATDQGATMDWSDTAPTPQLDANGNYTGDGAAVSYEDLIRFNNSATWWLVNETKTLAAQLTAIQGALSTDEAALLAAIKGVQAGTVDVTLLAQALVPLLAPADAAAFQTALAAALAK